MSVGRFAFHGLVWLLAATITILTFLPLWNTNIWWVRFLDFPRLQIAAAAIPVLIAALFLRGAHRTLAVLAIIAACGYQLCRILPYTPLFAIEMVLADHAPGSVRILSSNVLMENDRHDLLIDAIERFDPDILLLMEVDRTWLDALEPVLAAYPTVVREPRDDHYGMIFAARLDVSESRTVYLTESDTPSLFAELVAPDGTPFRFVGLHPRPPVPGFGTRQRDAQIRYAARFASRSGVPLISTGDFNDVAWSDTSQTFKHVGQYLDPRIGRGFFVSFDAERWWLRFPIDQLYVTADIAVVSIERLPYIGSDHFPMGATVRIDAQLAGRLNSSPAPLSDAERTEIETSVERRRQDLGHSRP